MPGGGVGGQNLGHLQNVLFTMLMFLLLSSYLINGHRNVILF